MEEVFVGTEFKMIFPERINSVLSLEDFRKFKYFWKREEKHGNYFLGRMPNSDWSEIMVWVKDGALGVTVSGVNGEASDELKLFVKKLKNFYPGLEIVDWDSGDDLSDEFFRS